MVGKKLQLIKFNLNLSWAGIWAFPPRCPRFESQNSQNFLTRIFASAVSVRGKVLPYTQSNVNIFSTKVSKEPIINTLMEAMGSSNQHQLSLRWHTANCPIDEGQMIIFAEFLPRRWQMADIIGWWASNFMMAPLMEPAGPELGCVEKLNLLHHKGNLSRTAVW